MRIAVLLTLWLLSGTLLFFAAPFGMPADKMNETTPQ